MLTECDENRATASSWERSIRKGNQSRDLGLWVGTPYLHRLSVKGKRGWVPVRRNVSKKRRGFVLFAFFFFFFARESEEVCR